MKTLNKEITIAFYNEPQGYEQLAARWSEAMQDTGRRAELTCAHHVLYSILRGRNWQTGLTPITNAVKLANGAFHGWAGRRAIETLHSERHQEALLAPFADLLSDDALDRIRQLVPSLRWGQDPLAREPYASA